MGTIKILIADTNGDFRDTLSLMLASRYHVRTCADGSEAERLLQQFQPDIFVLDLMLPCRDGLFLLSIAASLPRPPLIVVISRFISEYVQAQAITLNVQHMMRKPCDIGKATEHIRRIAEALNHSPTEEDRDLVSETLLELGFKPHRDGFQHLKTVIPLFAQDPCQPICKVVYDMAGKSDNGSSPKAVEKAIRDAITAAWSAGDRERWLELFPRSHKAPSNKVFISRIAELLHTYEKSLP